MISQVMSTDEASNRRLSRVRKSSSVQAPADYASHSNRNKHSSPNLQSVAKIVASQITDRDTLQVEHNSPKWKTSANFTPMDENHLATPTCKACAPTRIDQEKHQIHIVY